MHGNSASSGKTTRIVVPPFSGLDGQNSPASSTSASPSASDTTRTAVGQQAQEIGAGVARLQTDLDQRQHALADLRGGRTTRAADYFNRIATINARLQAGTTAGNPLLVAEWREARSDLTALEGMVSKLSEVSAGLTDDAAVGLYLSNQVRSTLALPGALDEDHVELNRLNGEISVLQVQISQVLGDTLAEINRQNEVLAVEYRNIATTSHAIEVGQILGDSLASVPVGPSPSSAASAYPPATSYPSQSQTIVRSSVPDSGDYPIVQRRSRHHYRHRSTSGTSSVRTVKRHYNAPAAPSTKNEISSAAKPLMVISGDPKDTAYEDRLYTAVSTQLEKNPNARFNVKAVALAQNSAARWAIQSVELEQKANAVARSLTAYGLPRARVSISQGSDPNLQTGEIQIYAR